jgi:hypothetical protein
VATWSRFSGHDGSWGTEDSPRPEAFIDVLVPAYTSRARENVQVADDLFTIEVPGLQLALARPPVNITLELHRFNGTTLQAELPFPDEVSALVLKSLATTVRSKDNRHSRHMAMPGDSFRRRARTPKTLLAVSVRRPPK